MAYTYYVYHKPTKQHYYGARWAKNCHPDDLWVTYFTSCRKIKQLIETYGTDSFEVDVRRVFASAVEARSWEHRVLKKIKAVSRKDWLNSSNGQPPICNYSRVGQGAGRQLSNTQRENISKAMTGRVRSPFSEEHKRNMSTARIGKKHSAEVVSKLTESNRRRAPVFIYSAGDQQFCGTHREWIETTGFKYHSSIAAFSKLGHYKGWVRRAT